MPDAHPPWSILLDFDGTVTAVDADFYIADLVYPGGPRHRFYAPHAAAFEALQIGTLEYFDRYLDGLGLPPEEMARWALQVPVRSGLGALRDLCQRRHWRLTVLSEGLDVYIRPILRQAGLADVPCVANRVVRRAGRWRVAPAAGAVACSRCLNCKGEHARRARREGHRVAVVGNGVSDLCAAREADLVLARDSLTEHCRREGIAFHPWQGFNDVVDLLGALPADL